MTILPTGAELFLADGQTHDEARRIFAIWRTRLDTGDETVGCEKLRANVMLCVIAGLN
jgi:hypothetical protein